MVLSGEDHPHEGPSIGIAFGDDGILHVSIQVPARSGHSVADVVGGEVDVLVEFKLDRNPRDLFGAEGSDVADTCNPDDLIFQGLGYRCLDDLGGSPG